MPNTKQLLITALIALAAVAIAYRIPAIGNLVFADK
jgi:hypothetical protein